MNGSRIEAVHTSKGDFTADDYVVCGRSWSPETARGLHSPGALVVVAPDHEQLQRDDTVRGRRRRVELRVEIGVLDDPAGLLLERVRGQDQPARRGHDNGFRRPGF